MFGSRNSRSLPLSSATSILSSAKVLVCWSNILVCTSNALVCSASIPVCISNTLLCSTSILLELSKLRRQCQESLCQKERADLVSQFRPLSQLSQEFFYCCLCCHVLISSQSIILLSFQISGRVISQSGLFSSLVIRISRVFTNADRHLVKAANTLKRAYSQVLREITLLPWS